MTVFVDTSALVVFLDTDSQSHEAAVQVAREAAARGDTLVTSNYALLETAAVCQRRFGIAVARRFLTDTVLMLTVLWVDEQTHVSAVASLLAAGRRDLSLVDCTSFEIMRRQGIQRAFALDKHFAEQGFECVP